MRASTSANRVFQCRAFSMRFGQISESTKTPTSGYQCRKNLETPRGVSRGTNSCRTGPLARTMAIPSRVPLVMSTCEPLGHDAFGKLEARERLADTRAVEPDERSRRTVDAGVAVARGSQAGRVDISRHEQTQADQQERRYELSRPAVDPQEKCTIRRLARGYFAPSVGGFRPCPLGLCPVHACNGAECARQPLTHRIATLGRTSKPAGKALTMHRRRAPLSPPPPSGYPPGHRSRWIDPKP